MGIYYAFNPGLLERDLSSRTADTHTIGEDMKEDILKKINEIMQKTPNVSQVTRYDIAKLFVNKHPELAFHMVEDWLGKNYKEWTVFHKQTSRDGYRFMPSKAQCRVLRRMLNGDTVGPVQGKFRWLEGSDTFLSKRTVDVMFQEGWIESIDPTHTMVEFEFTISNEGKLALEAVDLAVT